MKFSAVVGHFNASFYPLSPSVSLYIDTNCSSCSILPLNSWTDLPDGPRPNPNPSTAHCLPSTLISGFPL